MIKIVLHALPNELDQVMWIIDQLVRNSKSVNPKNYILDFTLNVSDEDVNWKESMLSKEYCIDKFNLLFKKSPFVNFNKISELKSGCNSVRRDAIRSKDDCKYIVFLDTDIIFPDYMLFYLENSLKLIKDEYFLITPQIFQLWDTSWDVISHPDYRNVPRENKQWTKNPYQVFEHKPRDIKLIKSNTIKFAGGWFNTFSKKLLELIDIPDSLGHYGLDDTFIASAASILRQKGYKVNQYIINDLLIKEDRVYRSYSMDKFIKLNNNQESMRELSTNYYKTEIEKFIKRI